MILKQVIKYENAPALEATWVERIQLPDREIPAVLDEEGNELEPARTEPGGFQEVIVKCQAYSNGQMDMLAADLGADAPAYQALMDEIAATYVPPEPEPPYIPQSVTPRQARLALFGAGLLDQVEMAIESMEDPTKTVAKINWEYATAIVRTDEWVVGLGGALGLTDEQLDQLFITASEL